MWQSIQERNFCRGRRNGPTEREGKLLGKPETRVKERAQAIWWCRCVICKPMPMVPERYCCHEQDLVTTQLEDLSETEDVSASHTVYITNHRVPCLTECHCPADLFSIFQRSTGKTSQTRRAQWWFVFKVCFQFSLHLITYWPLNKHSFISCFMPIVLNITLWT